MQRGYYITANDKVLEHAIALINSIRRYDADTPICMIPYDENYHQIAAVLGERFGVTVFDDLELVDRLSNRLHQTFGNDFFARPNVFRKWACWFGPFEEFIYIDTDIVVFEKLIDYLDEYADYDFLCCDYQHQGGLENVFNPVVLEQGVFTEDEVKEVFNSGFWASKKSVFTEAIMYEVFEECAQHPEYFDFSQKTSDQPIMNYLILSRVKKRFNIVRRPQGAPGNWGGSSHFITQDGALFDPTCNQRLQYIHWAGIRIEPGCPYWEIWAENRYWGEEMPEFELQIVPPPNSMNQSIKQLLKSLMS